jgi:hypothetical protein
MAPINILAEAHLVCRVLIQMSQFNTVCREGLMFAPRH